jgi:hypothetical protein
MGTWGAGNFDNDGARDWLGEVMTRLEREIDACLATPGRADLDEDGEGVLMPTVAILTVLAEHCDAPPPVAVTVRTWRAAYLAIFDDQIDDLEPAPGFKDERRQVIEATFAKLEAQALAFWQSEDGSG